MFILIILSFDSKIYITNKKIMFFFHMKKEIEELKKKNYIFFSII
jgi:hypothetical protein